MIINPRTEKLLEAFTKRPDSSLLLLGSRAQGTDDILKMITDRLLDGFSRHNIITVRPVEGKGIAVEQIREFKKSLTSKVKSDSEIARIGIVFEAGTATKEAQNTLLKLIEEPVDKTLLILQAGDKESLLPTILSRCQTVPVLPITTKQAMEAGKAFNKSEEEINRLLILTDGGAMVFKKLLQNADATEEQTKVQEAKQFLKASVFERLSLQKEYASQERISDLLTYTERIAQIGLHARGSSQQRFKKVLIELRETKRLQKRNVPLKLIFLRLCVTL